jgi:hypothetical protein
LDFLGYSYWFRTGRGQHDALDALAYSLLRDKTRPPGRKPLGAELMAMLQYFLRRPDLEFG